MKASLFILSILSALIVCAEEVQIDFDVRDYEGNPIEGVDILCATSEVSYIPYAKSKRVKVHFTTNRDGKVRGRFKCWEGFVDCYFRAEGYYPEDVRDVIFKAPYEKSVGRYVFKETEKKLSVKMRKIKNPISMVFHRQAKTSTDLPAREGRFAFDLKIGDWVRPNGKGEVADFVVAYWWHEDDKSRVCTGAVEFVERGCGAYVRKKYPCRAFPVEYSANDKASYVTHLPFSFRRDLTTDKFEENRVISEDEYIVIRSRAQVDARGEVLEANYSQIQGPVIIGRFFSLGDWYFNPRVNDLNLEYAQPK